MSYSQAKEDHDSQRAVARYGALGEPMPCLSCGAVTPHDTLRMLGARCHRCYLLYCSELPRAPDSGDKTADPKSWAHQLRRRELAGERLTKPQRDMWRSAIGAQE